MKLAVKTFDQLTTKELYEILRVRAEVFVVEQNCVYQDLDEKDMESFHLFYEKDEKIQAYLRIFVKIRKKKWSRLEEFLRQKKSEERGRGLHY